MNAVNSASVEVSGEVPREVARLRRSTRPDSRGTPGGPGSGPRWSSDVDVSGIVVTP